jgi:hypothetical protein
VVGIALIAVCGLLGARLLGSTDDTVGVWAARGSMSAGSPVGPADLVSREVRFADQVAADRYLSSDAALPAGATLERGVEAGELVPRSALGAAGAGALIEVPLSVVSDAVPATLRVGTVVDVWVTPDRVAPEATQGSPAPRSTLVFDEVEVVALSDSGTSLGPTTTRQVIVGVDEDQEPRLPSSLAALAGGVVVLTARR